MSFGVTQQYHSRTAQIDSTDPTPGDDIRALASTNPSARRAASIRLLGRARDCSDDLPLEYRASRVAAGAWAEIGSGRIAIIAALVEAIQNLTTDLLTVNALAYVIAAAGEEGVTELLPMLRHPDFAVRGYAAEGLGSLDSAARWAVPALIDALAEEEGWPWSIMLRALGNIGGRDAVTALEAMMADARRHGMDIGSVKELEAALASAYAQG